MQFRIPLLSVLLQIALARTINEALEESEETVRVVGGRDAAAGQFPWAESKFGDLATFVAIPSHGHFRYTFSLHKFPNAALFKNGRFLCTCSIISPNTVLTAAHCVVSEGRTEPARLFHAIANVKKSSPTVRIEFSSITPHPQYSESGIQNDIAIFRTTQPIPFSDTVKPICIARSDTPPMEYSNATAMGWGDTARIRLFPIIPDTLQYVEQNVISNEECARYYGEVEDYKICAGDTFAGICNGDSGGPLVYLSSTTAPIQLGVASYGSAIFGCGFITPSVWTRVSSFNSFIKEIANGDELCEL